MSLRRLLTSLRTSAVLLCVLAFLLLLNVVVPQEMVIGEQAFRSLIERSDLSRFFLSTLGLGRLPVSPLFLGLLALFLLNLAAVLISRVKPP
jgi:hypothetical protein